MVPFPNWRELPKNRTSCSDSGYGSGRRSRPRTMLKTLVVAPMASASVRTTTTANPGLRVNSRNAPRRSCRRPFMVEDAARSVPCVFRGGAATERLGNGKPRSGYGTALRDGADHAAVHSERGAIRARGERAADVYDHRGGLVRSLEALQQGGRSRFGEEFA